jgi:hypothetical protein
MKLKTISESLINESISYDRVIPRDLFNEAKLLKCIGRLCLLIHDGKTPIPITFDHDGGEFRISMTNDGSLIITNIEFSINNQPYYFKTTYNSKSNYPLYMEYEDVDYLVFDESGEFDKEFLDIIKEL